MLLENHARTFGERLSKIEASRKKTGRLQDRAVVGDQISESAGTGERAVSASGRRDEGVYINSLRQAIGEVEVARGSRFAL